MFKKYLMLLLFAHVLGDFYAQTSEMAKKKRDSFKWVMIHALTYWGVMFLVSVPVLSKQTFAFATISAVLHMVIDILKHRCNVNAKTRGKGLDPVRGTKVFFVDQALHVLSNVLLAYLFAVQNSQIIALGEIYKIFETTGISALGLLTWALIILVIHKPANIAISRLLQHYKPSNQDEDGLKEDDQNKDSSQKCIQDKDSSQKCIQDKGRIKKDNQDENNLKEDKNAGRLIGTLERMIIVILISLKQYSAIGLVLTAKSIARYDKITKDAAFAEYYLLGTLLSTLSVIAISVIL